MRWSRVISDVALSASSSLPALPRARAGLSLSRLLRRYTQSTPLASAFPFIPDLWRLGEEVHINQTTIQSRNHHLDTVSSDRCTLSAIDSKRFILQDLISTRALGHVYNEGDQWDWDLGLPAMDLSE